MCFCIARRSTPNRISAIVNCEPNQSIQFTHISKHLVLMLIHIHAASHLPSLQPDHLLMYENVSLPAFTLIIVFYLVPAFQKQHHLLVSISSESALWNSGES